ncbi:ABC transporter substrate-binding protein [Nocardioides sp. Y6]|uniref:ABC transporter substrate-binding protein n=1 Tax=Nocardioides malaquae TaxID=2773426 RepID=A0ABR9RRN2_9ACTN|nr:ABC transporter substrate-binding protein [Nocardioides malaquae]MBE7324221.1 ABC transporter substrate-binding protein [Nocardioides malaquae]
MSRRLRALPALAALALVASACSEDTSPSDKADPVGGVPVEITDSTPEDPVRIGVVVTLRSEDGLGEGLLSAAAGAQVAESRLELGGGEVMLEVADDRGTAEGARAAISDLVGQDVSGIVVATTGDHLTAALRAASDAGTPVVAPYLRDPSLDLPGVWATGPDDPTIAERLQETLDADGLLRPFVVTGDGVAVDVDAAASGSLDATGPKELARQVARRARSGGVDSVVVGASAPNQAAFVAALQGADTDVPVHLTPEALSPEFASALVEAGGTTMGDMATVGTDATDATSLGQGDRAEAVAAYFAALRLLAGDPEAKDLFGSAPFAQEADGADIASHDAVVGLVVAAAEADSVDPAAVKDALAGLQLTRAQGLAGPPLDFTDASALDREEVVVLRSSGQDPGVRPVSSGDPVLRWFAVPTED